MVSMVSALISVVPALCITVVQGLHSMQMQPVDAIQNVQVQQVDAIQNVHALATQLSEMDSTLTKKLVAQRAGYEAQLTAEHEANSVRESDNMKLKHGIQEQSRKIFQMRNRVRSLQADIKLSADDLESLRGNFSLALETVRQGRTKSPEPKLEVLAELEQADKEHAAQTTHEQMLTEVEKPKLAALQLVPPEDPTGLLRALDANFQDLASSYEDKEKALTRKFERLMEVENNRKASLLQEQSSLNATLTTAASIAVRLEAAMHFLENKRTELVKLSTSLRMYSQRVGMGMLSATSEKSGALSASSKQMQSGAVVPVAQAGGSPPALAQAPFGFAADLGTTPVA